jgi:hypothetical protein
MSNLIRYVRDVSHLIGWVRYGYVLLFVGVGSLRLRSIFSDPRFCFYPFGRLGPLCLPFYWWAGPLFLIIVCWVRYVFLCPLFLIIVCWVRYAFLCSLFLIIVCWVRYVFLCSDRIGAVPSGQRATVGTAGRAGPRDEHAVARGGIVQEKRVVEMSF